MMTKVHKKINDSPSAGPRMISGQRQSPEAVVVPVVVVVVVPKLVVVAGQIQGVVVEEVEEVEEESGVKSWAGFMSNSWSGSGVDKLSSPKIFVIVVSVKVGFAGPGLISSEFDSFSTVVRGIVCTVCPPSNCEDKGCSVSVRWVGFV